MLAETTTRTGYAEGSHAMDMTSRCRHAAEEEFLHRAAGLAGALLDHSDQFVGVSLRALQLIVGESANAANRAALGVQFQTKGRNDLTIGTVVPGSPAAAIGLRSGDRIVSVNGSTYADVDAFVLAAGQIAVDQDAEVVYLRDGVVQTATVRFAPWNTVYGTDAARTHTTLRPALESGTPLPAAVQPQGSVNPGYFAPHQGNYPQYQRYYRYGYGRGGDFDDDDCFDD